MDDLINRQAAIDAVSSIMAITGTSDDKILLIDKAEVQTELMMLPAVEPEMIKVNIDHDLSPEEYEKLRKCMANAPIILLPSELERKTGKWFPENRRPKSMMFYCSECKRTAYDPQYHYGNKPKRCRYAFCPNCGAKMED